MCVILKYLMKCELFDRISLFGRSAVAIRANESEKVGWEAGRVAWMEMLKGGKARWEGLRCWC